MHDEIIYTALKKKPEKGLKMAMDKYTGLVYHIAASRLKGLCSKEDIEELCGDVFFSLYNNRNTLNLQKGSIKAYLCKIALNKATDIYRKKSAEPFSLSLDEEIFANSGVEEIILKEEKLQLLALALKELEETDRKIIVRKAFLGYTSGELAKEFALSDDAVRKRISRGYALLREKLKGVI